MAATAIVTEIQESDASVSTTGTWATVTSALKYSGGTLLRSNGNGNTMTVPFTGRSIYVLGETYHHGFPTGGAFTYTIDGVAYGQVELQNDSTQSSLSYARVLLPLARNLPDGAHTLVLTTSVLNYVAIDSFLVVSGARQRPLSGLYVALGDSWTKGSGCQDNTLADYPHRVLSLLQGYTGRPCSLVRKGSGGDSLHAIDGVANGDSSRQGGMYRTYGDMLAATPLAANGGYPEFVSYLFGANDLRSSALTTLDNAGQSVSPGTFGRHLYAILCLLEDTLPVRALDGYATKVAIGTPQYVSPWFHVHQAATSGGSTFNQGLDAFEEAVAVTRAVVGQFPWCRLAQVYEALDGRDYLLYPNAASDAGLHANESGHNVVAHEFVRAFLGGVL